MRTVLRFIAVIASLVGAGKASAHSVWIDVTPKNIDQQLLAFTVKDGDAKECKEFEITVEPKVGKLPPARFLVYRFNELRDDRKITAPTVKRVDREGESAVFSFQIPQKDLKSAKFSLWQMSYVETKDAKGNLSITPMPSATVFTFALKDFIGNTTATRVKAVYFVSKEGGELSPVDLKKHREVKVVNSFQDLQRFADKGAALWIDVTAIPLLQGEKEQEWIIQKTQEEYTFAMVGCNEPLRCFRDMLDCFLISGPGPIDWTQYDTSRGFSVIRQKREKVGQETHIGGPMRGYKGTPTIQKILNVTDALLADKDAPESP